MIETKNKEETEINKIKQITNEFFKLIKPESTKQKCSLKITNSRTNRKKLIS